jgi:hypothetical protein
MRQFNQVICLDVLCKKGFESNSKYQHFQKNNFPCSLLQISPFQFAFNLSLLSFVIGKKPPFILSLLHWELVDVAKLLLSCHPLTLDGLFCRERKNPRMELQFSKCNNHLLYINWRASATIRSVTHANRKVKIIVEIKNKLQIEK